MTFEEVKNLYTEMRDKERKKLVTFLKENGFEVVDGPRAGRGRTDYTAKHTFVEPYDLSNWKYVECYKDGYEYFLSLQAFDTDPGSQNHHVLMDRIGLYKYIGVSLADRKNKYVAKDAFETMKISDVDLPLNEEKLKKLLQFMEQ